MTLLELANSVCGTVNETEAADVTKCKEYLTNRHKMLWADQLWKDSLVEYTQTITPDGYDPLTSTWLPDRQILLVKSIIERVVAIRTSEGRLGPQSAEFWYNRDYDSFQNIGSPVEYRLLSPVVWDMDAEQELFYAATEVGDEDSPVSFVTADDSLNETKLTAQASTDAGDLGLVQTIVAVAKGTTEGSVFIGPPAGALQFIVSPGGFIASVGIGINQNADPDYTIVVGNPQAITVSVGDVLYFFDNGVLQVGLTYTVVNINGQLNVVSFSQGDITFTATPIEIDPIVTLAPDDTAAPKRQRVQLIGSLNNNIDLRILGKRTCPSFEDDSDEPAISGMDNVLIAFAIADMLRRGRQYGRASNIVQTEATPLLAQLIKQEVVQQANRKRLVPVDGFGAPSSDVTSGGWPW